jgi:membrane protein YdbS with pleckstrin-like domain
MLSNKSNKYSMKWWIKLFPFLLGSIGVHNIIYKLMSITEIILYFGFIIILLLHASSLSIKADYEEIKISLYFG